MDKVPAEHAYLDVSDYARPLALRLVHRLPPDVTPVHLTLAFTAAGAAAAWMFAVNRYLPVAGLLLLLKSLLDAADGSLARYRRRPSRVGRFLDSVCDFVVTVLVFGGIAWYEWRAHPADGAIWLIAVLAILSATLQCSVYSHYAVRYRARTGGDSTSRVLESAEGYAGDDPRALAVVYGLYRFIYGWQDWLMAAVDGWLAPASPVRPAFVTAASGLGLGTQLLVLAICAILGQPILAFGLFIGPLNLYWLFLLVFRYATRLPQAR